MAHSIVWTIQKSSVADYFLRRPDDPEKPLVLREHQRPIAWSKSFATFGAGGWASAKTWAGLGWLEQSIFLNPGCTHIIMAPTYKLTRELVSRFIVPALAELIVGESRRDETLYLADGGRIVYISGHVPERLEMYTAASAWLDEGALVKGIIYTRLNARLREARAKHRRILITGVPHHGWLKDVFEGRDDADRKIVHLRTSDNLDLPPDVAERIRASAPARMIDCYLNGQFVAPRGSVYAEFDSEIHIVPWTYRPELPVIPSIDWSPRTPHVLFVQLVPDGVVVAGHRLRKLDQSHEYAGAVVFDELVLDGGVIALTSRQLCAEIRKRGYRHPHFCCDPAGKAVEATSGTDQIATAIEVLGISPRYRTDRAGRSIINGVEHVKALLAASDGVPRLYFATDMMTRCETLPTHLRARAIGNAMRSYSYPDEKEGKAIVNEPIKDGISDHACDCLRYLVVNHFPLARLLGSVRKGL